MLSEGYQNQREGGAIGLTEGDLKVKATRVGGRSALKPLRKRTLGRGERVSYRHGHAFGQKGGGGPLTLSHRGGKDKGGKAAGKKSQEERVDNFSGRNGLFNSLKLVGLGSAAPIYGGGKNLAEQKILEGRKKKAKAPLMGA